MRARTHQDMVNDDGASLEPADAGLIDIDLRAVVANLGAIRRLAGPRRKIIATVKADAYGHGCVAIGQALQREGVDWFAAGNLADAAAMRGAGITASILLLGSL